MLRYTGIMNLDHNAQDTAADPEVWICKYYLMPNKAADDDEEDDDGEIECYYNGDITY